MVRKLTPEHRALSVSGSRVTLRYPTLYHNGTGDVPVRYLHLAHAVTTMHNYKYTSSEALLLERFTKKIKCSKVTQGRIQCSSDTAACMWMDFQDRGLATTHAETHAVQ